MKRLTRINRIIVIIAMALLTVVSAPAQTHSNKQERNHLRAGNKLFKQQRYAEAEVEYRKALQSNTQSETAQFNLATALMCQGNATASQQDDNNPMNQAEKLLTNVAKNTSNKQLRGKASYDLGNIAYSRQQYDQAIEHYKNALRCDPSNNNARDNLRLAQLKKKDQDKNKDKNKDQNQDKNKDQNQDQNKNQDKQDQDKNQDKDKQDQDKQDQDKQNQDKQNQDQQDQQNNKQQQQQGGMSEQNAEQVLKAMQNQERATQQRILEQQAKQQRHERQRTNKKW